MAEEKVTFTINEGVSVASEVMSIIAGLAATEIEGVQSLAGNITADMVTKSNPSKLSKGVKVISDEDNNISVRISLNLQYGYEIPKICAQVQDKVKTSIESMTGMNVTEVDVRISAVSTDNI